jgi:hypothetical protein
MHNTIYSRDDNLYNITRYLVHYYGAAAYRCQYFVGIILIKNVKVNKILTYFEIHKYFEHLTYNNW